jgi:hypothetical protein
MIKRLEKVSSRFVVALVGAAALSSAVGCSVRSQLDDMHGATLQMNKNTDEMNDRTKRLADSTDRLLNSMGEMYASLKQGDSLASRRAAWKAMVEEKDINRKFSEAGKYFLAFEYQLWSGIGQDTPEMREAVAASAAREFMRDVKQFIDPGQTEPNPFGRGKLVVTEDNRALCLNALAAAMSLLNYKQEVMLKKDKNLKAISMYSMIQDALRASAKMRVTGKVGVQPAYVVEVLESEEVARLLLQARYNGLGVVALAMVSDLRLGLMKAVAMSRKSWDLKLDPYNIIQTKAVTRYLKGAIKTHEFMMSVGLTPVMDENLKAMLGHLQAPPLTPAPVAATASDVKVASTAEVNEKAAADLELVSFFDAYKKSSSQAPVVDANTGAVVAVVDTAAPGASSVASPAAAPAPAQTAGAPAAQRAVNGPTSDAKPASSGLFSLDNARAKLQSLNQFFKSRFTPRVDPENPEYP